MPTQLAPHPWSYGFATLPGESSARSLGDWIPPRIRSSRLMEGGGFALVDGLLDAPFHRALLAEAMHLLPSATEAVITTPDTEEVRGGRPRRRLLTSPGSDVQDSFYLAPGTRAFLEDLVGLPVRPSGSRSTYSFYARPGDFLALHRDVEECELAVLTCLHDVPASRGHGGILRLYPHRVQEPLSAIRQTPEKGALPLRVAPGQTLVFFGGVIPHELVPVATGQVRIMSVLCYLV